MEGFLLACAGLSSPPSPSLSAWKTKGHEDKARKLKEEE